MPKRGHKSLALSRIGKKVFLHTKHIKITVSFQFENRSIVTSLHNLDIVIFYPMRSQEFNLHHAHS